VTARCRSLIIMSLLALGGLGCLAFTAAPAFAEAPETPHTEAPAAVTGTTATLKGEPNPGAEAEVGYHFAYSTTAACTEGAITTLEPEVKRKAATKVASPVTGLEGSTTYTVCLVATNPEGETIGSQETFTTLGEKPVVGSESPSGVTPAPFEATLEAAVNPENQVVASCTFEYGKTVAYGKSAKCNPPALEGASEQIATATVTGLEAATLYHYRVVVKNLTGERKGADATFTTATATEPAVESESAAGVTQTTASLSATINPEFQETTCKGFQYVEEAAFETTGFAGAAEVACEPEGLGSGSAGELTGARLTGLVANTTYHYRAVAENATGVSDGPDETFLTPPNPPEAITGPASAVTTSSATISGSVNPGSVGPNSDTTYIFQYGPTTSYGASVPLAPSDAGEGVGPIPETANIEGLESGLTYHYRIVADNDHEDPSQTTVGEDRTFATVATPPILSAVSLSSITQSSVTITAGLSSEGLPARYELQLGGTPGLLQAQAVGNAASGAIPIALSVGSLSPGTLYYYRLIATNVDGSAESEGTFTTLAGGGVESSLSQPATPLLLATPAIAFPSEPTVGPPAKKNTPLTRAQKLANAFKACKKRPKRNRAACEKQARKRYGAVKNKAKHTKVAATRT
jgi:phosphodiesterase/alkaline phosphatase D-like protein